MILLLICILLLFFIRNDIIKHFEEEKGIYKKKKKIIKIIVKGHRPNSPYRFGYKEKVNYYGFHFEEHKIETKDNYILTAWRIVKKDNNNTIPQKRAVILNHGLLDSAYTFLAFEGKECLPLILAELG